MVFSQEYNDFEVIIVDNDSSDGTLTIAQRFPIAKTLTIKKFMPGHALNEGIRASQGKYIVCLSAHCIPESNMWLSGLLENFSDPKIAGVYGRQIPVCFSDTLDKRDLINTFGLDRRIQVKDTFFHNANSMILREIWEKYPFDENVTNIEDRVWGKAVIDAGFNLAYEPEAMVYHYHGVHQSNDPVRAKGVVSIIEQVAGTALNGLPDPMKPENCNVMLILPVLGEVIQIDDLNLLKQIIKTAKDSKYIKGIYVFSESESAIKISLEEGISCIRRPEWLLSTNKSIEDVLQFALTQIEETGVYPDIILYANYLYPFRPKDLFDNLICDYIYKGLDNVFPGFKDFQNYWELSPEGSFKPINENLKPRDHKNPLFRSLYGLGCVTSVPLIRSGKMVGGKIGILPLEDPLFTIKYDNEYSRKLIMMIYHEQKKIRHTSGVMHE